jgi:hypothetical protein
MRYHRKRIKPISETKKKEHQLLKPDVLFLCLDDSLAIGDAHEEQNHIDSVEDA